MSQIEDIFNAFDIDNTGTLTQPELESAISCLDPLGKIF